MRTQLEWEDGVRAAAEGKDLAAVARGLSDEELLFWIPTLTTCPHEQRVLQEELWARHPSQRQIRKG
jgi:hypothetical protein